MKVGDIVLVTALKSVMGEIKAISENLVTVALCNEGIEIKVNICDLKETGALQPNTEDNKEVNILGTIYKIRMVSDNDYRAHRDADGWADYSTKELYVYNYKQDPDSFMDLVSYQKKVIRHEIVHAFFYESGLWCNSLDTKSWARNEEMVDWIAIQEPKLHKSFKEAGVL